MVVDPPACEHSEEHERDAKKRALDDAAGSPPTQVEAHQDRNRNRREHRGGCPRTVLHRIDHDESEHRDQDDHDHQRADQRGETTNRPELIARHLSQAPSVPACRQK